VFNPEYNGDTSFCPSDEAQHINGVLFSINLDGSSYLPCSGGWYPPHSLSPLLAASYRAGPQPQ